MVRETDSPPPPEQLLQAIWQHQRLNRNSLRTTDSRPLRVLHPGFLNHEAGPDFQCSLIQLENNGHCTGDIEVDPRATDWRAHGHDTNPAFSGVILHVIWNGPAKSGLPTLRLQPYLDTPISGLNDWHRTEPLWPVVGLNPWQ